MFSKTVSIQLVVPVEFEIPDYSNQSFYYDVLNEEHPCGQPHEFMQYLLKKLLVHETVGLYPQNHMRNIARKVTIKNYEKFIVLPIEIVQIFKQSCPTAWVFMTDVDIIPRPNASSMINTFYNNANAKCSK